MNIKGVYNLVKREGLKVQIYSPRILICRREFFVGNIDFDIRIGDSSVNKALKYKCFGFKLFGFGIGIAWWKPQELL